MPDTVAIVTDSTAYLPADLVQAHGLTVVPLQVVIGGRSLAEGLEVTSDQVAEALGSWRPVTTSRPSPELFARTYRSLAQGGASAVVSVHLSGELSGTAEAARLGAREVRADGLRVEVVDSRSMGMGLGFTALAAARAAAQGRDAGAVADAATRTGLGTSVWLYVDTLEYLRRGGRIGAAAAMLGSALSVKPLLQLVDGRLEPLERVRTASRALARLEELVVQEAGDRPVDVAVQHLASSERAQDIAERLRARLPHVARVLVGEVGAVVGAHVGPGMLGVALAPGTGA